MKGTIETRTPMKEGEFEEHCSPNHEPPGLLDEFLACSECATCCKYIIDDQNPCTALKGIFVDLEGVCAVLELVRHCHRGTRQFPGLPNKAYTRTDPLSNGAS